MSKLSSRGAAWESLRRQTLDRDGHICQYCGREATEADHIIPKKAGGTDTLDNLTSACKPCNASKQDRMISRTNYVNRRWLSHV